MPLAVSFVCLFLFFWTIFSGKFRLVNNKKQSYRGRDADVVQFLCDCTAHYFISRLLFVNIYWQIKFEVRTFIHSKDIDGAKIEMGVTMAQSLLTAEFLLARRYASAGNSDRNVSVCPSVTRRYCVKTKKASGMISSPSGRPKTLVFWRQISSPNSKGFPRTRASKKGRSEKFSDFLALSVNISKTVADTAKVTISH